jgi:acetyltransferase
LEKRADIKKIFNPETVALIGATDEDGTVGRTILQNLLLSKNRKIFAVNPNRKRVLESECFPGINDVPTRVDLAIIATPPQTVPDLVEECGKAGVEGMIIISSGFKEMGEEGRRLEKQITEIRKTSGVRIVGPNSLGMVRPNIDLNASLLETNPERGNIALISQGGALGAAIFDWAIDAHIGFSFFISLGSMIDIDFGDLIDFLGNDPHTRSIMLYMEEIADARKFMSAARGFAHSKPIIVVKPGRFRTAPKPALSHTGALVGCDQVYSAAFKRAGVVRIKEVADFFNTVRVLHLKHLPKGPRLAIVTNVAWVGVMATDAMIELGGKLATLSEESNAQLSSFLPPSWSKTNPIDLLGDADVEKYVKTVNTCLDDPEVDGVFIIYTPQNAAAPDELAEAVVQIARKAWKPIITTWMGGKKVHEGRKILFQHNIPTYETPEDAVKTYLYMYQYERNLQLLYETPAELPVDRAPPKNHLKALIRRAVKEGRIILNEEESKRFLVNYGIPTISARLTQNVEGAISIAKFVGYPTVLKIVSPDITYKSDVGGVVMAINSDERLHIEFDKLIKKVRENVPDARISGVTVQKMVEKIDYEIILGAKKDNDFGPVILFGMGGTGVQILKDFSIGLAPLNQTLARRLMEETEVYKMLRGYRGKIPADLRQLEQIIVSFSNLIADFPEIAEMDINPIAISEGKAWALDARIIIDSDALEYGSPSQYPHLIITPYPTRLITNWTLYDGSEVVLRPIKPEDEPLEYELLASLSEESLKGRFFQKLKNITHEMLIRECNIDYDREMNIVAEIKEGQRKKLVGVGRLIIEPDFKKGEFAVVVHDQYQAKGLGYKICDILIGIAQEKGLERFLGMVLTSNKKMISLCRKLGFTVENLPDGISLVELVLR